MPRLGIDDGPEFSKALWQLGSTASRDSTLPPTPLTMTTSPAGPTSASPLGGADLTSIVPQVAGASSGSTAGAAPLPTAELQPSTDSDGLEPGTETSTINPYLLQVLSRPGRGRGVFASRDLAAGTLIEDAPVLVITQKEWDEGRMNDSILGEYGFCWSNGGMAIGLGMGECV